MISNVHRFHGRSSLRFVYQRGQTVRGQFFSLRYVLNGRQASYRTAVVVSRKVSKSAVVRNRIRRRVYEIIRNQAGDIPQPYDLVFTIYSDEVAHMSHGTLKKALISQLEKAGALSVGSAQDTSHGIVRSKETEK